MNGSDRSIRWKIPTRAGAGHSKGRLFSGESSREELLQGVQNIHDDISNRANLEEVKRRDKPAKISIGPSLHVFRQHLSLVPR